MNIRRCSVVVLLGLLAALALWLLLSHTRDRAFREISQLGGIVSSDGNVVALSSPSFGDDDLHRLAPSLDAISNLRVLALNGTEITDASVAYLKKLHDSRGIIICLDNTSVSDEGRRQIQGIQISAFAVALFCRECSASVA